MVSCCQTESLQGCNISESYTLPLPHTDPARIINSSTNMTVNESDSVVLICCAVGFPIPTVTWSKMALGPGNTSAASVLTGVQVETSTEEDGLGVVKTEVRLSPVQLQDRGVYACHVINTLPGTSSKLGVDVSRFSLTVQCKQDLAL